MNPEPAALPLRDIHLPEPVGWWPLAPGWWLLMASILSLSLLVWWIVRRRRHTLLRREGLKELDQLEAEYRRNGNSQQLAQQLSVLLRRIALSRFPRYEVASLTGTAWLDFLDRSIGKTEIGSRFRSPSGTALIQAPYDPNCAVDAASLIKLSRHWIIQIGDRGRASL